MNTITLSRTEVQTAPRRVPGTRRPSSLRARLAASLLAVAALGIACDAAAQQYGGPVMNLGNLNMGNGAGAAPASGQWQRVNFPDGSGSVEVPAGWRVTASRGIADIAGPNGEIAVLGFSAPVVPMQVPGHIGGPYQGPANAFAMVADVYSRRSGYPRVSQFTAVQPTAPLTQNAQAAFVSANMVSSQGRNYKGFALVNTALLSGGYWQYYHTALLAPAESWQASLPTLIKIWQRWAISDAEMSRRLQQAISTNNEITAIMAGTVNARKPNPQHARVNGTYYAGRWIVEDTHTGQRYEVTFDEMNKMMAANPGRYRALRAAEF